MQQRILICLIKVNFLIIVDIAP
uniref:Uncharacterized protein n=1 Tax=Physcomitrium patens TaxID=3218 RepID=A0A2K1IQS4_PHYPA|nr:hypothetical protein PHYPA_025750 [Physcomitrium patens]